MMNFNSSELILIIYYLLMCSSNCNSFPFSRSRLLYLEMTRNLCQHTISRF